MKNDWMRLFVLMAVVGLFLVAGCNKGGRIEGAWDADESETTPAQAETQAPPEGLAAPVELEAEAGPTQVTLTWNEVEGAQSYDMYFSTKPDVSAENDKIEGVTSPYEHKDLTNCTRYYYKVAAVNEAGVSPLSNEASAVPAFDGEYVSKLLSPERQEEDRFGFAVAAEGDVAIVGAPYEDGGAGDPLSNTGAAYVFKHDGDNWVYDETLPRTDAKFTNDTFGFSLAIDGGYAIVGSPWKDIGAAGVTGAAYVYKEDSGGTWNTIIRLVASPPVDSSMFGHAVSISGNYAIVGAPNTAGTGRAYIYKREGDVWEYAPVVTLNPPDLDAGDGFGAAVSIDGDYAIVSAPSKAVGGHIKAGKAYLYHLEAGTWNTTAQEFVATSVEANAFFGWYVSLSGPRALIGAYKEGTAEQGAAYVFERSDTSWGTGKKLTAPETLSDDAYYGARGDLVGNCAAVTAIQQDPSKQGAVFLFLRDAADSWTNALVGRAPSGELELMSFFGHSVSLGEEFMIVSAPAKDYTEAGEGNAGAVYIFK